MKLIDKDALVAEIEKRIKEISQIEKASYEIGLFDAYKIVLRFLDTLEVKDMQEEPVSEDLEKAAEEYAYTNWASDDYHEGAAEGLPFDAIGHTEKCFKAGAKWDKNQAKVEIQAQSMALAHGCPKESTTENLDEYVNELSKQFPEVSFAKLSRIAVRVSRWQRNQDTKNKAQKGK